MPKTPGATLTLEERGELRVAYGNFIRALERLIEKVGDSGQDKAEWLFFETNEDYNQLGVEDEQDMLREQIVQSLCEYLGGQLQEELDEQTAPSTYVKPAKDDKDDKLVGVREDDEDRSIKPVLEPAEVKET